ncbi:MAG TPA: NUDIX hydrolase [Xanthobacteraceae bacterium]|nr:NUDIX hydrolase [Xanthobacteraceae bacterium]
MTAARRFATTAMMSLPVIAIDRLDIAFEPRDWPFARERRADIDAHFAERRASKPHMWNGRIVLTRADYRIEGGALTGTCFEADFASLLAWRDWGFPEAGAVNCFAMGALRSADGAFLLGVMGAHTANADRVYFPAGTPEPGDIVDGQLDLAGSVAREVAEETGLVPTDYAAAEWHAVPVGARLALIQLLAVDAPARELRDRMREHLAGDAHPELADIFIVRGPEDFDPRMPSWVTAYLEHRFRVA